MIDLDAIAGRGVDQERAEQRQRSGRQQYRPVQSASQRVTVEQPRPARALGAVAGDGEAVRAGHVNLWLSRFCGHLRVVRLVPWATPWLPLPGTRPVKASLQDDVLLLG